MYPPHRSVNNNQQSTTINNQQRSTINHDQQLTINNQPYGFAARHLTLRKFRSAWPASHRVTEYAPRVDVQTEALHVGGVPTRHQPTAVKFGVEKQRTTKRSDLLECPSLKTGWTDMPAHGKTTRVDVVVVSWWWTNEHRTERQNERSAHTDSGGGRTVVTYIHSYIHT